MSESAFDAVVIGSGLGGLTAAALMAKAGRKVCVIERNHSVGGAASAFKHGALTIEPALHQTADPHDPAEPKHAILTELGLLDEIEWVPVSPFFSVKGGPVGEIFDLPVGFDAAHHALSRRFPESSEGVARLLGAMEQIVSGVERLTRAGETRSLGELLHAGIGLRRLARDWRASTADILHRFLGPDEAAKFAVAGNIGYYADDPSRLAWPFFAMAQGMFLKAGGRFIKGGSRVLTMKLARIVTKAGGSVLLGRDASAIAFDGPVGQSSSAMPIREPEPTSSASARSRSSPIALPTCSRQCCRRKSASRSSAPMSDGPSRFRCSPRISASTCRRPGSGSTAITSRFCPAG